MAVFHTTTYKLYNKLNFKIVIISDIHFSYKVKYRLNRLLKYIKKLKPNYILIPGDLIDSNDMIKEESEKIRLINWLKELGKISKVIISLGNHDSYIVKEKGIIKCKFKYYYNSYFYNEINSINNIYLLDNKCYKDENIYVAGITLSNGYYNKERVDVLRRDLKNNSKLIENLPADKLKLLMIHSPFNLKNKKILEKIDGFDYFITGHMHNGCVPPIINEIWNSNKGIIGPSSKLLTSNSRGILKKKEDKLIINGPVTTFQVCSGIMQIFNIFYPIYNIVLEFNNKNDFKRKRKYHI